MTLRAWLLPLLLAACASAGRREAPPAAAGDPPILFHRVLDEDGPHPVLILSWDTARAVNATPGGFAGPALVDQLAAACADTRAPRECRMAVRVCREKLCRVEQGLR